MSSKNQPAGGRREQDLADQFEQRRGAQPARVVEPGRGVAGQEVGQPLGGRRPHEDLAVSLGGPPRVAEQRRPVAVDLHEEAVAQRRDGGPQRARQPHRQPVAAAPPPAAPAPQPQSRSQRPTPWAQDQADGSASSASQRAGSRWKRSPRWVTSRGRSCGSAPAPRPASPPPPSGGDRRSRRPRRAGGTPPRPPASRRARCGTRRAALRPRPACRRTRQRGRAARRTRRP